MKLHIAVVYMFTPMNLQGHYSLVLTYLEMASYISYWGSNTEIFELLLFAGANPNNTVEEFEAHVSILPL